MTQVTRAQIEALLMEDGIRGMHAIGRALVALYKRQTSDEQVAKDAKYRNNRGFTHSDAKRGCGMAEFYMLKGYLTPKQVAYWRKAGKKSGPKICKYAGQLLIVAQEKAAQAMARAAKLAEQEARKMENDPVYVAKLDSQAEMMEVATNGYGM